MFNPLNIFSKLIKSGNEKELGRIQQIVNKVNLLEKDLENLSDEMFPKKTEKLIEEICFGTSSSLFCISVNFEDKSEEIFFNAS